MPAGKKTNENCNIIDLYFELLVKKERTAKDRLVKGSIIALIVLLVLDENTAKDGTLKEKLDEIYD